MKIIKPYMSEELLQFKQEKDTCLATHEQPRNAQQFFITMAGGNYKFLPHEINDLVSTYQFFALYEEEVNVALIASSIAGGCADSVVDDSNKESVSLFLSEAVEAVCSIKKVTDAMLVNSMTKSIHRLVAKHLPHLSLNALGLYLEHSRKLTHWASPEFNEMSFHPDTEVLDHPAMTESMRVKPNQALRSIIEHFFDSDSRTYSDAEFDFNRVTERSYGDGLTKLTALANVFIKLDGADQYLPVKYQDLILVGSLVDRFAIAAGSASQPDDHAFFSQAATSLTRLCRNFPKEKISKDHNLFLRDSSGFEWIEQAACEVIEPAILKLMPYAGVFNDKTNTALRDFHWCTLKNALRVHARHQESGYDNSGLVRGLVPACLPLILDQKNLEPFGASEIGLLISCVDNKEIQRTLLSRNKDSKGRVLMDSMGL